MSVCRFVSCDMNNSASSSSHLFPTATMSITKKYSYTIGGLPEKLYCSLTGRPNKNKHECSTNISYCMRVRKKDVSSRQVLFQLHQSQPPLPFPFPTLSFLPFPFPVSLPSPYLPLPRFSSPFVAKRPLITSQNVWVSLSHFAAFCIRKAHPVAEFLVLWSALHCQIGKLTPVPATVFLRRLPSTGRIKLPQAYLEF